MTIFLKNPPIRRHISGDFARHRAQNHEKHSGEVQEGAENPLLQSPPMYFKTIGYKIVIHAEGCL